MSTRQIFDSKCELPHTPRPIPQRCCRAWADGPSIWEMSGQTTVIASEGGTTKMNSRRDYVDLPGSERAAHPLATIEQPPVDPEEHATVTIVPANLAAIPAIIAFATENHLTTSIEHGFVK